MSNRISLISAHLGLPIIVILAITVNVFASTPEDCPSLDSAGIIRSVEVPEIVEMKLNPEARSQIEKFGFKKPFYLVMETEPILCEIDSASLGFGQLFSNPNSRWLSYGTFSVKALNQERTRFLLMSRRSSLEHSLARDLYAPFTEFYLDKLTFYKERQIVFKHTFPRTSSPLRTKFVNPWQVGNADQNLDMGEFIPSEIVEDLEFAPGFFTQSQFFNVMGYVKQDMVCEGVEPGFNTTFKTNFSTCSIEKSICPESAIKRAGYTICPDQPIHVAFHYTIEQDLQAFLAELNSRDPGYQYNFLTDLVLEQISDELSKHGIPETHYLSASNSWRKMGEQYVVFTPDLDFRYTPELRYPRKKSKVLLVRQKRK